MYIAFLNYKFRNERRYLKQHENLYRVHILFICTETAVVNLHNPVHILSVRVESAVDTFQTKQAVMHLVSSTYHSHFDCHVTTKFQNIAASHPPP